MTEQRQPVRIAINVMRTRLTVVGFNLAIITFQLTEIRRLPGGVQLPNLDASVHIEYDTVLLMGLGLSILAMISFTASSTINHEGICTHWSLLAGDLLMYLGLAHSVSGFFSPLVQILAPVTLDPPNQMVELETTRLAILIMGGCTWFCATYIGPAVSLLRSPFGWRITTTLGVAYLVLLFSLSHVSAQALRLEAARSATHASPPPPALPAVLKELVQPLRW